MAIEKQKIIIIAGVVLAAVAIMMFKVVVDQKDQAAQQKAKADFAKMQASQTAVLVAKQDIAQGSVITPEMLESSIVPNKFVQPKAATSVDRISGMVTVAQISKGEQISLSKLTRGSSNRGAGGNLAGVTPAGKRAITIAVDSIATLSGMVRPGDYVDVLVTVQVPAMGADGKQSSQLVVVPLFQNILVLAIGVDVGGPVEAGRYAEKEKPSRNENTLVTLALAPQDANLLAFVQEQGKLRLVLRSPADSKLEPIAPASWETLFQYIAPPKPESEEGNRPLEPEVIETVEVLRGLSKESVPLSK